MVVIISVNLAQIKQELIAVSLVSIPRLALRKVVLFCLSETRTASMSGQLHASQTVRLTCSHLRPFRGASPIKFVKRNAVNTVHHHQQGAVC